MAFLQLLRFGLQRARRHPLLLVVLYLLALFPAVLAATALTAPLAEALDRSPYARDQIWTQPGEAVFELLGQPQHLPPPLGGWLLSLALLVAVAWIWVSAGLVEALLEREAPASGPFSLGLQTHGWRFLRSAVAYAFLLVLAGVVLLIGGGVVEALVESLAGIAAARWVSVGAAVAALLLWVWLDLAYDLSRIAAASHGHGSMLRGLLRAAGHVPTRLSLLLPFALSLLALAAALFLVYRGLANAVPSRGMSGVLILIALQQLFMLGRSGLKLWAWGGEIAYYQAIGEPPWCAPKRAA